MPLVNFHTADMWDGGPRSLYRAYIDDKPVGFVRAAKDAYYGDNLPTIMESLKDKGLVPGQRIVLAGGAFGWIAEGLIGMGYGPIADGTPDGRIAVVDFSLWIHNNLDGNAILPIIMADLTSFSEIERVKTYFGGELIDWVLSEDILPTLSDTECVDMCRQFRTLATNVVHLVSTGTPTSNPVLNWKTLEGWKNLNANDLYVERSSGAVL